MEIDEAIDARRRIFQVCRELRELFERAAQPGAPNRFEWKGETWWVDQVRCFALRERNAREFVVGEATTLPHDEDVDLEIQAYTSRFLMSDFLNFWAAEIAGRRARRVFLADAHLVNLVGGQPLVNPAFAPLFWLAVREELVPSLTRPIEIWSVVWDMIFDMANYPLSRSKEDEVRRAQVDFVVRLGVEIDAGLAVAATDDEWTATCERVLEERLPRFDSGLFTVIVREAGQLSREAGRK
jgi:hypothetical protein